MEQAQPAFQIVTLSGLASLLCFGLCNLPRVLACAQAHVIVEFDRQRGILLGAGGAAIKALAVAAREEIEEFVGKPVFLQLSVKVQKRWRKDPALLERLGY